MRRLRGLIEGPMGRWLMLGLLIFILAVFTVTDEMTQALRRWFGDAEEQFDPKQTAGSFTVVGGDRVNVSYDRFDQARNEYFFALTFFTSGAIDNVYTTEVWTYLMLLEAAKKEGITISPSEVVEVLKRQIRPAIWDDRALYKQHVRKNYGTSAAQLEDAIRKYMTTTRVRELYWQSYMVAPPATREEIVKQYAGQPIEYVRGHVAALDAEKFLQPAADELKAESDPDAKLKEFFAKDPEVKNADDMFRHPRRYVIELLYSIHKNLKTDADVDRIIAVFAKTYPDLDTGKLEANVKDMKDFFGIYRDRLLDEAGTSWAKVEEEVKGDQPKDDDPAEKDEPVKKDDEPEKKDDPAPPVPLTPELRQRMFEHGFKIVQAQIARELKVRGMFQWFRAETGKDETKSLKELFDLLKKSEDPENPVLGTEPGKSLIVYREFTDGLSGDELEAIEDSGVKFTHNYRSRVTGIGDTDLPKLGRKADVLGMAGHGRQITRLLEVKRESRKTFDELTPGERKDLRDQFYLPARARERAKEALQALRKRCIDDEVKPEDFLAAAEKQGARVHRDEWIEASYDFMAEPDRRLLWPAQYLYMRDRYFLHTDLAGVFARDRAKQALKAGSYVDVQVDSRPDSKDPGAAYLFLLLERRKPDAASVPPSEINSFTGYFRRQRVSKERERWNEKVDQLLNDFNMEFYGDMKRRIQDELQRRQEALRRRAAG